MVLQRRLNRCVRATSISASGVIVANSRSTLHPLVIRRAGSNAAKSRFRSEGPLAQYQRRPNQLINVHRPRVLQRRICRRGAGCNEGGGSSGNATHAGRGMPAHVGAAKRPPPVPFPAATGQLPTRHVCAAHQADLLDPPWRSLCTDGVLRVVPISQAQVSPHAVC